MHSRKHPSSCSSHGSPRTPDSCIRNEEPEQQRGDQRIAEPKPRILQQEERCGQEVPATQEAQVRCLPGTYFSTGQLRLSKGREGCLENASPQHSQCAEEVMSACIRRSQESRPLLPRASQAGIPFLETVLIAKQLTRADFPH